MGKDWAQVVARNIRRLRKEKYMSQDEFASVLGITGKHLGRIERGHRNPTLEMVGLLCQHFDLDESYFYRNELEQAIPLSKAEEMLPSDIRAILEKRDGYINIPIKPEWQEKGIPPEDFARIVSAIYLAFQKAGVKPGPEATE